MKKRLLILGMIFTMAVSSAGCGSSSSSDNAGRTDKQTATVQDSQKDTSSDSKSDNDKKDAKYKSADEITMEKIMRGRAIKLYDEDQELLEDVLIEIKQAIEMSNIYLNILSGTMDAFASVISNNLNVVMKVLASITLLMSIPTIISSFYGMNVDWLPFPNFWFPTFLAAACMLVAYWILKKKEMFH